MNKKVTVVASQEGVVVRPNANNPESEFGFVRVSQVAFTMENGFQRKSSRSALINGKKTELVEFGYRAGMELDGKIIVKESLAPFNKENPDSDIKLAGESGVPCTIGGQVIYRKSFYVTDDSTDSLIAHDNGDAIKAKQATLEGLAD